MEVTVKDILSAYSLTQSEFSRMLGIPLRTVQGWCLGERKPPAWTLPLFEIAIKYNLEHKNEYSQ